MTRWITSVGSLVLLSACRLLAPSDKRPAFHGSIRKPAWIAEGIAAESVDAFAGVVLVMGTQDGNTNRQLMALDASSGRRLWTSSTAAERVVAMGLHSAFVLDAAEQPPDRRAPETLPAYRSHLHWVDLATGQEKTYARNWTPFRFAGGTFYGFDEENYLVSVDEQGNTIQRAYTAFAVPLQIAIASQAGPASVVVALGRTPGANQQRLAVYNGRTLRSIWAKVFPLPDDWVGHTDLLVGDGAVFVTEYAIQTEGDSSTTHAFDAQTGKELWQRVDRGETREEDGLLGVDHTALLLKKPYKGYTIQSATSGIQREGLGFDPAPFFVMGIDTKTGKDLWSANLYTRGLEGITAEGGLLYTRDKKYYAVIDEAGHATPSSWLTCVDPATSTEIWRTNAQPDTYYTKPVAVNDLVFVGGRPYQKGRGKAVVMAFKAGR